MSKIPVQVATNSVDVEFQVNGNDFISISLAAPDSGTQTAGTMTFEGRVPGAADFEALSPNTIDISAPVTLKVDNQVLEKLRVTITGHAGTATAVNLSLNDWGVIRK